MTQVVSFPGVDSLSIAEVGGKGLALVRLADAGLPVPPGAILSTQFFQPWIDQVRASALWKTLEDAAPDQWTTLCEELKRFGSSVSLTAAQEEALEDLRARLRSAGARDGGGDALFAVRSSSPEEDLASASFAGGYETRLGVSMAGLEEAVRHCFASCLDERVFAYKQEHGFDVLSPRLAVVVQQQIDSDVAGVGFSLNPLTNDYDEAVVDANWGQGEAVVSGRVSPDHFVVDKVSGEIVEQVLGSKEVSIWLDAEGGTSERRGYRCADVCLGEDQIRELTDLVCRVEELYRRPVDIEWAYAGGTLHLLQARPVTTYVPLPPEMQTEPGERRRLYADIALSGGFTINAPISPMGLACMEEGIGHLVDLFFGPVDLQLGPGEALWFFAGGRMYQDLSNVLWLASPEKLGRASAESDALMADILASVDAERYRATTKPSWAKLSMVRYVPRFLWRSKGLFLAVLRNILFPERSYRRYRREVEAYEVELAESIDEGLSFGELRWKLSFPGMHHCFAVTMPALAASLAALAVVGRLAGKKSEAAQALAEKLKLGFTGNVVAEMGIALFRLAKMLPRSDFADLDELAERIEQRRMPAEFLGAWDAFLATYGRRGPLEMDLARPRYADDPALALRQMSLMTVDDERFDPEVAHRRRVEERREAYKELMRRSGWLRRILLRRAHQLIELFAGTRDTPKHQNLLLHEVVRQRALREGQQLVRAGRLDAVEHVFDLTFEDLVSADSDPALDLRQIREERTCFLRRLAARVKSFPAVIDSRGRILRPAAREERPGELTGRGLSPGVVTGPVKILHHPREKPVDKGDILVAHTTDPGWTPLFVNAAAVVLEIGGVLQHGAVIAREYGKPCVAGIDSLLTRLEDGQVVEVDGTAGVVRIVAGLESAP